MVPSLYWPATWLEFKISEIWSRIPSSSDWFSIKLNCLKLYQTVPIGLMRFKVPRVLYIPVIEHVTFHVPCKLMKDLIWVLMICLCFTKIAFRKILVFYQNCISMLKELNLTKNVYSMWLLSNCTKLSICKS